MNIIIGSAVSSFFYDLVTVSFKEIKAVEEWIGIKNTI